MNETADTLARLAELWIVRVVEVKSAEAAAPLAKTLADVGLPVIELTLRTPAALKAIERVAAEYPDVLVGAGTVLDARMVHDAHAAGARFRISPGVRFMPRGDVAAHRWHEIAVRARAATELLRNFALEVAT